ncbi:MAG: cytochrome c3 family protein [Armatimonadetes bacterium]|nr:cytochrome C [Armatimonadota bacterium]MBS1702298.1 cytochrome c3 family protein [Armatimonadota bacterium]MBS1727132.1 cytochrome c3 family protein [Armatimonadota bacterium]
MGSQVFKPNANSIARITILAIVATPLTVGLALAALSRSPANTKVNIAKNQPVPFSHQHHNWELGIDCRYCHTSVEKSSFAGIPAVETCMSCHSQIWTNSPLLEPIRDAYATGTPIKWNRVNKVPDFVYFNHSIHINRGLNCNICHGPMQDEHITAKGNSFQMAWCLQCHRAPERYLGWNKDLKEQYPNLTPRELAFKFYWKLQTVGKGGLSQRETELATGQFDGSDHPEEVADGKEIVKQLGIKVQQDADCTVCHR